ncbi:MAG: type VI secretion system accessory protein TagJ [Pirellulaceae bacterium]
MNAKECFQAGRLDDAIAAALGEVKQHPTELASRSFLCELLCYTDDLERADKQLDVLTTQDPEAAVGVSLFRQLVRAEQARRQFFSEGRLPEFLGLPTPAQKLALEASIEIREGKLEAAAALLDQADAARIQPQGACDGQPFDDFRDLDDLIGSNMEVLTSNGKYYWIPIERIELIELRPPRFPRDLLWLPVHMIVRDGPDGEVYLPTLYAGSFAEQDDALRLGRATDWRGDEGQPVRGVGLRSFLVGEEDRTVLQPKQIEIQPQ